MREVLTGVLPNGFRFYSFNDSGLHLGGVGARVGSLYDPPDARGMAHSVEHLICRETENYPARNMELILREHNCGPHGDIKIYTTESSVFLGTEMLLYRTHMERLFPMFVDMVKRPLMKEAGWQSEKSAEHVEYLERGIDALREEVDQHLFQLAYKTNPIRNRVDCELEELRKLNVERVREFKNTYFVPNNMFAIILGPKFHDAKNMVKEHFGDLKSCEVPKLAYDFSDSFPVFGGVIAHDVFRPGFNTFHVNLGFPVPRITPEDEEDAALDVLCEILEYRIEEALRGRNRAWSRGTYHPVVSLSRSFVHGLLRVWWPTPSLAGAEEGERLVLQECERVKGNGFIAGEVEKVLESVPEAERAERRLGFIRRRRALLGNEVTRLRKGKQIALRNHYTMQFGELAELIIDAATNGDEELIGFNSYPKRLAAVTRRKVVEVANKYLKTDAYARVVIHPGEPPKPPEPPQPPQSENPVTVTP